MIHCHTYKSKRNYYIQSIATGKVAQVQRTEIKYYTEDISRLTIIVP